MHPIACYLSKTALSHRSNLYSAGVGRLVLASRLLAGFQLVQIPAANVQVGLNSNNQHMTHVGFDASIYLVRVHAFSEGSNLLRAGAALSLIALAGVASTSIIVGGSGGLRILSRGSRAASKHATEGMTNRRADCYTTGRCSQYRAEDKRCVRITRGAKTLTQQCWQSGQAYRDSWMFAGPGQGLSGAVDRTRRQDRQQCWPISFAAVAAQQNAKVRPLAGWEQLLLDDVA
jgi:hypothetical protein